jgi:hypothetical protein
MNKSVPVITMLVTIPFVALVSACNHNTPALVHAVYTFDSMHSGLDRMVYHPGDQWTLEFRRKRIQDSDAPVTHITLTAQLFGPFSMPPTAKTLQETPGPVAVAMPAINTTDSTATGYTRAFQLPKNLAPGYYYFVQSISSQGNGASQASSGGSIIHVVS